ncbi:cell division protein ZapE [Deinococcus metalli]|uniref:Cell division protein ZapE n=1 Tax=Deinococcus metalli TaxID=1141878 RepID=A0A7W8KFD1_9DEIO|nr:cell division protein ZapE [Deinococcus metalli]MBB5375991.1 cell division protein ZapE [Deinococcus metalli]GHF41631.1 cell division protein ZapE [Deinococcus metalli]
MIDLTARHPPPDPQGLLAGLTPSARFQNVRFDTYRPNPSYASQQEARASLQAFLKGAQVRPGGFRLFRRAKPEGRGLYLDGGFGVGKTHLLASTYFAAEGERALMSFQDLMYLIGALGMTGAVQAFRGHDLLLIDEFELDDPGNTHMANTFLGQLMPAGTSVVATSNTEPGALGQGRFNAADFQRQIQGIADRFDTHRIDGPDYRQRGTAPADVLAPAEFAAWQARQDERTLAVIPHRDLNRHLLAVHPSRFSQLLEGVGAVGITELGAMPDQNVALRFVHFVDKLYDLGLPAAFTGAPLGKLFSETYRHGAYAKKYSRCLSRVSEMVWEARGGG